MKATLIIKNIENLYTCDKDNTVLSHAFIALYHNTIIDVGTHDFKIWLEDTTRVIDANGEVVIPALIDCNYGGFYHVRLGDQLRQMGSALFAMQQNGILNLLSTHKSAQRHELTQDVFIRDKKCDVPIIDSVDYKGELPEKFLLSCGFGRPNSYIYSFQPLCYLLSHLYQVEPQTLLNSMTKWPAEAFGLKDRGSIEVGKNGDILILQVPTIEHYFQTMDRPLIHRMIKNGIQFYPDWLVC